MESNLLVSTSQSDDIVLQNIRQSWAISRWQCDSKRSHLPDKRWWWLAFSGHWTGECQNQSKENVICYMDRRDSFAHDTSVGSDRWNSSPTTHPSDVIGVADGQRLPRPWPSECRMWYALISRVSGHSVWIGIRRERLCSPNTEWSDMTESSLGKMEACFPSDKGPNVVLDEH